MGSSHLALLVRLGRLQMTVFSAVTYGVACSLALSSLSSLSSTTTTTSTSTTSATSSAAPELQVGVYVCGYFFLLLCQLTAHFLGEYHDFHSDRINYTSSPMTGGSKVLVTGEVSTSECLVLGYACMTAALGVLAFLPSHCLYVGLAMVFLAHQYSAPPFKFNHRGLGELCAAVVMNILLPWFAALAQSPLFLRPEHFARLLVLILPSTFIKFSLFLVLNMADRRPDWAAGKNTLPVLLGDRLSCQLLALVNVLAYTSFIPLWVLGLCSSSALALAMASAPWALRVTTSLNKGLIPYKLHGLVAEWLRFAPVVVLIVVIDCLLHEIGGALFQASGTLQSLSWSFLPSAALVILQSVFSFSLQLRLLPLYPFLYNVLFRKPPPPPPAAQTKTSSQSFGTTSGHAVIIAGAGIGGLVLGLVLKKLGIPFRIIEKASESYAFSGADLALWPSAIKILKALGVGEGTDLFGGQVYPVHRVEMQEVAHKSAGNGAGGSSGRPSTLNTLRSVSMDNVVRGSGESFCLVERRTLTEAIVKALGRVDITYNTSVTGIEEDYARRTAWVTTSDGARHAARVVVGADGIHSTCRKHVTGGKEPKLRFGGEVCYRGLVDTRPGTQARSLFDERESELPGSMNLVYDGAVRFSWGYINNERTRGYWFIKRPARSATEELSHDSPYPLSVLLSTSHDTYVHEIQDRAPLPKWSSLHVTLVGDACHAVTPNNGQGACMAIEDAFVLGTLLRTYDSEEDGHLEAFYQYERLRREHCTRIHAESHRQMKIGQLRNPLAVALRRLVLRAMPASVFERKLRESNMFAIDDVLLHFKSLAC